MIKHFIVVLALTTASLSSFAETPRSAATGGNRPSASASSGNFGLGIMLGEPSGITAKYWLSRTQAFDVGLSYSFDDDYFALLSNYLWHFPALFGARGSVGSQFVPYLGIGGVLAFDDEGPFGRRRGQDIAVGARIPLGVEFLPRAVPLGIFAELAPGVGLIPEVFGFLQGEVGGRFYF